MQRTPWYRDSKFHVDSAGHSDAAESAFVENTLKAIATELAETLYPPEKWDKFLPVDATSHPGAVTYAYRMLTRTGVAQLSSAGRGDDAPNADLFVEEFTTKFYQLESAYQYTWKELQSAEMSKQNGGPPINIDAEKARAAKDMIWRGHEKIAALGSSTGFKMDPGLVGIANHPNASTYTIPNGAGGSPLWANKTPDEVVADLFGICASQYAGTFEIHNPRRILLPTARHQAIAHRRMGDGSDETILSFFMKTRREIGMPVEVESWHFLNTAGSGSTARMIAYNPDPRFIRLVLSDLFRQFPPQVQNLVYKVLCIAQTAGVVLTQAGSLTYGDTF